MRCQCTRRDFIARGMYGLGLGAGLPFILNRTSAALAAQALQGTSIKLPAKTSSYKAWGEHLQVYAATEAVQAELNFWQQQLAGAALDLPCDNPQGSRQTRHAQVLNSRLDKTFTQQLLQRDLVEKVEAALPPDHAPRVGVRELRICDRPAADRQVQRIDGRPQRELSQHEAPGRRRRADKPPGAQMRPECVVRLQNRLLKNVRGRTAPHPFERLCPVLQSQTPRDFSAR